MDFYKHDIPDWMDGTEGLNHTEYRVYHVVCMLIYLSEGPIVNNERGIAGRCNMHLNAYRSALQRLVQMGKLSTDTRGRLTQHRADTELRLVAHKRETAGRGGRHKAANALKKKEASLPVLEKVSSIREKSREEKNSKALPNGSAYAASSKARPRPAHLLPDDWQPTEEDRARGIGYGLTEPMIDAAVEEMRNWARANAHRTIAKKSDWNATFRGWMQRNADRYRATAPPKGRRTALAMAMEEVQEGRKGGDGD